jgi:alpha-D-ribose 1-methylphosphonate 5-triphosphate diphosphatase
MERRAEMRIAIEGGQVLTNEGLRHSALVTAHDDNERSTILPFGAIHAPDLAIDATGLLVLPGIIDIHGDAFERQIEPRPGVQFPLDIALTETDRQLAANGITTAYHGITASWEPGLRSLESATRVIEAIARLSPSLAIDTRVHLRHETFNLAGESAILDLLQAGRIGCLAFNDHMTGTIKVRHRPDKMQKMIDRSGLSSNAFNALVEQTYAQHEAVPASIARLAAAGVKANVPLLSHDDLSPDQRAWFRALGVTISEFPTTDDAAQAAIAAGEATVFGAPNVMRGGSHTGCPSASDMVARGLCTILASDYYYPALLQAPFALDAQGTKSWPEAWALVSRNPARVLGLSDRGELASGKRADVILVDTNRAGGPHVVATIANGRLCHLTDATRIGEKTRSNFNSTIRSLVTTPR